VTSGIENLLRQDRKIVATGLLLVTMLSWGYLFAGAGMGMSGLEMTRHSQMGMDAMPAAAWSQSYLTLMFFMWWIMMIAMMLPSAAPVILLAAALNRRTTPDKRPYGSTALFATGYLIAWSVFSALAVGLQWALQESGLINGMIQSRSISLSAGLLIIAGAWQFTSLKYACLRHCRGPVEFLTQYTRRGNSGALTAGVHHGLYCLGCCWFLMLILFVGGTMNLLWIAGLAIYVWIEKILPASETVSRVIGGLLIAWGAGILAAPTLY
jgi:predicted metal-binding membrane protein